MLVIGIPSFIHSQYRTWVYNHNVEKLWKLPSYDSIWFEGQATRWGEKYKNKNKDE